MKEENICTVVCEHKGLHEAVMSYRGGICQAGAIAVERQFKSLFGYYQYNHVELRLESPGGSIDAMQYILRQMSNYEEKGKEIAVRSTFVCASAAAIMLAMGHWGGRSVDRSTTLLFHSARVETVAHGMTAAISTNLSQTLTGVDRRLVDVLIGRMVNQAGGEVALAHLVLARCQKIDRHWDDIALNLNSLYPEAASKRRPDWFKALSKIARIGLERGKFALELKTLLYKRMQYDVRMDLREAFCTCLIDEVVDVIDAAPPVDGDSAFLANSHHHNLNIVPPALSARS
jgi:hypothetical protein